MTREEVVQAALTVERWCKYHEMAGGDCDCPFVVENAYISKLCVLGVGNPRIWCLERHFDNGAASNADKS